MELKLFKNRKAFVMTLDSILALVFMMAITIAISSYQFTSLSETSTTAFINLHLLSEDSLDVLNKKGILDHIGDEWTSGNQTNASQTAATYLDEILPPNMGYRLLFDGSTIFENERVDEDDALVKTQSVRLLAGYSENRSSLGTVARAFLTGITEKSSAAYAYFGGFVGQGNITR